MGLFSIFRKNFDGKATKVEIAGKQPTSKKECKKAIKKWVADTKENLADLDPVEKSDYFYKKG
jgi:hypothetical protein